MSRLERRTALVARELQRYRIVIEVFLKSYDGNSQLVAYRYIFYFKNLKKVEKHENEAPEKKQP